MIISYDTSDDSFSTEFSVIEVTASSWSLSPIRDMIWVTVEVLVKYLVVRKHWNSASGKPGCLSHCSPEIQSEITFHQWDLRHWTQEFGNRASYSVGIASFSSIVWAFVQPSLRSAMQQDSLRNLAVLLVKNGVDSSVDFNDVKYIVAAKSRKCAVIYENWSVTKWKTFIEMIATFINAEFMLGAAIVIPNRCQKILASNDDKQQFLVFFSLWFH